MLTSVFEKNDVNIGCFKKLMSLVFFLCKRRVLAPKSFLSSSLMRFSHSLTLTLLLIALQLSFSHYDFHLRSLTITQLLVALCVHCATTVLLIVSLHAHRVPLSHCAIALASLTSFLFLSVVGSLFLLQFLSFFSCCVLNIFIYL